MRERDRKRVRERGKKPQVAAQQSHCSLSIFILDILGSGWICAEIRMRDESLAATETA